MKAIAVFPATREVKLIEHEAAEITASSQVKLRMIEAGVCGTDREISAFQYGTPPANCDHLVIGHESLGEAVETGPSVTRVKPGDLVVPMVRRPRPHKHCIACRSERQDFCFTGDFTERGIKQAHGFMTESVVDDEKYMNVVPSALREVAVLVEPLTIRAGRGCSRAFGRHGLGQSRFRDVRLLARAGAQSQIRSSGIDRSAIRLRRERFARRRLSPGDRLALADRPFCRRLASRSRRHARSEKRGARAVFASVDGASRAGRSRPRLRDCRCGAALQPRGCPFQAWSLGELLRLHLSVLA